MAWSRFGQKAFIRSGEIDEILACKNPRAFTEKPHGPISVRDPRHRISLSVFGDATIKDNEQSISVSDQVMTGFIRASLQKEKYSNPLDEEQRQGCRSFVF